MEIIKSSDVNVDTYGNEVGGGGCTCNQGKVDICYYSKIDCFIHWN